jgi:hypothetical protein
VEEDLLFCKAPESHTIAKQFLMSSTPT